MYFSKNGAATNQRKKVFCQELTGVTCFRDLARSTQGNKDLPFNVLRKSMGIGP